MALTGKRLQFCYEYLIDCNETKAALRAGYSEKSARNQGHRLMKNDEVRAEIQRLMDERKKRVGIDADKTLINVAKMANYDIRDIVEIDTESMKGLFRFDPNTEEFIPVEGPQATIVRIKPLDDTNAHLITKIKQGKYGLEVEFPDRIRANELLGKHLKLFTDKQEVEHKGKIEVVFGISRPPKEQAKDNPGD